MLEVLIHGEDNLPQSIPVKHFIEATRLLCKMLGVYGRIVLRVRVGESGMMAATVQRDCHYRTIDFYDNEIRGEASAKPAEPIRDQYAVTLAHELIHVSVECRGSDGLPPSVEEHEALVLEEVYGPVALDIFKNGRLTEWGQGKGPTKGKRK